MGCVWGKEAQDTNGNRRRCVPFDPWCSRSVAPLGYFQKQNRGVAKSCVLPGMNVLTETAFKKNDVRFECVRKTLKQYIIVQTENIIKFTPLCQFETASMIYGGAGSGPLAPCSIFPQIDEIPNVMCRWDLSLGEGLVSLLGQHLSLSPLMSMPIASFPALQAIYVSSSGSSIHGSNPILSDTVLTTV